MRSLAVNCPIMDSVEAMVVWWVEKLIGIQTQLSALLSVELPDGSTTYSWHPE